ncbi:MAG: polysaccharide biosynthesis/export family protein [Deltaproteobacteria bacterium]|nr:polysaccharide biosynthesis/export family protein [Deltaproteobacteria bacterium]
MKKFVCWSLILLLLGSLTACVTADFPEITDAGAPMNFAKDQYVIGPEDVIRVEIWRDKTLSREVAVRPDGYISLPLVGDVKAAGLNVKQLTKVLTEKYANYLEAPNVSVSLVAINSFKIFIVGKVNQPGAFPVRSNITVLQAISMAGGFAEWASPDKIILVRQENGVEKRYRVDYNKIIAGKAPDIYLQRNDRLIVQ